MPTPHDGALISTVITAMVVTWRTLLTAVLRHPLWERRQALRQRVSQR